MLETNNKKNRGTSKLFDAPLVDPTAISDVAANDATFNIVDGKLNVNAKGAKVSVSDISGRLVCRGTDKLSRTLPAGLYIVTVGNKSTKVLVR